MSGGPHLLLVNGSTGPNWRTSCVCQSYSQAPLVGHSYAMTGQHKMVISDDMVILSKKCCCIVFYVLLEYISCDLYFFYILPFSSFSAFPHVNFPTHIISYIYANNYLLQDLFYALCTPYIYIYITQGMI